MTAQILRDPDTKFGVVYEAIECCGAKRLAHAVGLELSTIYDASNPNTDYCLSEAQFIRLDASCFLRCERTPYADWCHRQAMRLVCEAQHQPAKPLTVAALCATASMGALGDAILDAISDDGPGGPALTNSEQICVKQRTRAVRLRMDEIDRAADAGPRAVEKAS